MQARVVFTVNIPLYNTFYKRGNEAVVLGCRHMKGYLTLTANAGLKKKNLQKDKEILRS